MYQFIEEKELEIPQKIHVKSKKKKSDFCHNGTVFQPGVCYVNIWIVNGVMCFWPAKLRMASL